MRILLKTALFLAFPLLLASCGGLNLEEVALQTPPSLAQDAEPSPIGFNKIVFAIPTGTPLVSSSPQGLLGLLNCEGPYGLTAQSSMRGRGFPAENMREVFVSTMERLGYDVTGNPGRMFDEESDMQRTIYSIGGRITDVKIDVCRKTNFWRVGQGETGEGFVEVEWSVFDLLTRRTVYKATTKGYGTLKHSNYEGIELLFEDALGAAIHNLGSDMPFNDLVFNGIAPDKMPKSINDPHESPNRLFDPNEKITLNLDNASHAPAAGRWEDIKDSVVIIQKAGHGSGFFITDQGHILTNAHVVGDADRMRIVTSGKKEKLVAEVLRLDRKRDVALLKLEDTPPGFNIKPLPLRLSKTQVGEDIFVIGAPSYTRLQDTLTKGIVSAQRIMPHTRLPIIQADAEVHGGNSGGPLLDANGNVVGITVSKYTDADGPLSGLNNFIPIESALEALDINLSGGNATARGAPVTLKSAEDRDWRENAPF